MTSAQEISRLFTTVKQFASVIKMADGNLRRSSTKRQIRDRTSSRHRARVRSVETEITSQTTRLSRSSREYRSAARLLSSPLSAARLLSSPLSAARLLSSPLSQPDCRPARSNCCVLDGSRGDVRPARPRARSSCYGLDDTRDNYKRLDREHCSN